MRGKALVLTVGLLLGAVGCDHATKHVARATLKDRPPVTLVAGVVDLQYRENRGIAFNAERMIPEGWRWPVLGAAAVAALVAAGMIWRRRQRVAKAWREATFSAATAGYALIVAGALGNLLDRAFRGYVIDFIHVRSWPVFNVADAALLIGVGMVILFSRPSRTTTAA